MRSGLVLRGGPTAWRPVLWRISLYHNVNKIILMQITYVHEVPTMWYLGTMHVEVQNERGSEVAKGNTKKTKVDTISWLVQFQGAGTWMLANGWSNGSTVVPLSSLNISVLF